jgi:multisubunit Na+/H+ antiporter MnhB subunit
MRVHCKDPGITKVHILVPTSVLIFALLIYRFDPSGKARRTLVMLCVYLN